jgi:hypothetical protein
MAVLIEFRCAAHGPQEGLKMACKKGCPKSFLTREIRTAPSYRRGNMKFIDNQLKGIAADHGRTDLRNDPKSGESLVQTMARKNEHTPRWIDIPHADPGFSQRGETGPVFKGESMGFVAAPAATETLKNLPKPKPAFQARWNGK